MSSFSFSNFDFNVQNYSNEELEDLLGLKKYYSANDIMSNKQKLCIQLASATESIQMQSQMSDFLDVASNCLILTLGNGKETKSDKSSYNYFDSIQGLPKNEVIPGSAADGHFVIADASRMVPLDNYSNISGLKIGEYGAPPGKINPIKYSTIVSSINIDSRFRPNYFNSKSTDLHITLFRFMRFMQSANTLEIMQFRLYGELLLALIQTLLQLSFLTEIIIQLPIL
jgi:hypothetical protein